MRIAGMQKLTLLDFPGKTAATVFTPGCNFRCPFCHNGVLVGAEGASMADTGSADAQESGLSCGEVLAFLDRRRELLDGVCISGGEPLLQPGLAAFCEAVRARGFAVKLDTNGSLPDRLRALLDAGLIDMVAMDVKNAPARYAETIGRATCEIAPLEESLRVLAGSDVPFELRTTVVRELHSPEDLEALARWVAAAVTSEGCSGAAKNTGGAAGTARAGDAGGAAGALHVPWYLQSFKDSDGVLAGEGTLHAWAPDELHALLPRLQSILPETRLRGME